MADIIDLVKERIATGTESPARLVTVTNAQVTTEPEVVADEQAVQLLFPPLLKKLYSEIGNGGWGPGYGLLGLTGGATDDVGDTAVQSYLARRRVNNKDPLWQWPSGLLPICHWGCAIYSCIDCQRPSFPMVCFDPNAHDDSSNWSDAFYPEGVGFDRWIKLWAEGHDLWDRLYGDDGVILLSIQARVKS